MVAVDLGLVAWTTPELARFDGVTHGTGPRDPAAADDEYALLLVEPAPVPPHERSWRHPSELAPTRSDLDPDITAPGRSPLPLLAGTLAVAAVVVLVMAMTPRAGDDGGVAAVTTLPAFSTAPPSEATRAVAGVASGLSAASFGFTRLTAIPSAIAVAPSIADEPAVPVDDATFVYLVTDDSIYRTRWHVLRVHEDPSWLQPLGTAVVVTSDGNRVADIVDGVLVINAD